MLRLLCLSLLGCLLFANNPVVAESRALGKIEISFDYNRVQKDYANNQFAVWLEDAEDRLVKTLFVTQFTATKGWKKRKEALPVWREKVKAAGLQRVEVEAISGATPKAGPLQFSWELVSDTPLAPGVYTYFVECNYYWEDVVLYSGKIRVGDKSDKSSGQAHYSTENAENYSIIENVRGRYIPAKE